MSVSNSPNVYLIAGPNGSGKTTFAKEFLPQYTNCQNFINADLIAQGLAPFSPEKIPIKAGRILLEEIRNFAKKEVSFAFESTLSGKSYINFLKKLKTRNYNIHIFFLWIPTVNLAIARVKERVQSGGHNILNKDIRRRFTKSISNFFNLYQPLADYWSVIDNSQSTPYLIAYGNRDCANIIDKELFAKIRQKRK